VIQEADVRGILTRSVDDQVQAFGMTGLSKSRASRLRIEIDEKVNSLPDRPLDGD
jgi:putative transposase